MLCFVLRDDANNNMKRNEMDQNGEVGDVKGLWSTDRGPGSCQRPCNPSRRIPCPPFYFIIPSTSPWQTWSALYHRATGYLSSSPLPSFSFPAVLIPFVIYAASVSVSLTGTGHLCQARPRSSEAWQGVASVSPWWPNLEKPLNGFRHIC